MDLGDFSPARHVRRQLMATLDRLETACREQDRAVVGQVAPDCQPEREASGAEAPMLPWPLQRVATEFRLVELQPLESCRARL
eukprot:15473565-Alexandrium_andersonii.AAC.2